MVIEPDLAHHKPIGKVRPNLGEMVNKNSMHNGVDVSLSRRDMMDNSLVMHTKQNSKSHISDKTHIVSFLAA